MLFNTYDDHIHISLIIIGGHHPKDEHHEQLLLGLLKRDME